MKTFLASFALSLLMVSCCGTQEQTPTENTTGNMALQNNTYEAINTVRLTVAEGKRLIAKGLYSNSSIQDKLVDGMVIITRGSSNTYIAEEFVNFDKPHGALVTGKIIPTGSPDFSKDIEKVGEIIIVNGTVVDMPYSEALEKMQAGDIIFKGANLINYNLGQSAICIGAANGGTVGALKPYVGQGKGRWITPVGLEKDCSAELFQYSEMLANAESRKGTTLLDVTTDTEIYTEIEAIKEFADVDVYPIAKGGVAGAEGGISLMICGDADQVAKAVAAVNTVIGERPFAPVQN